MSLGELPASTNGPLPLKQPGQADLVLFYRTSSTGTGLIIRDLSGQTVATTTVPAKGKVMVGDYLPEPGWEVAIGRKGKAEIVNPLTGSRVSVDVPSGKFVSCIDNLRIP